MRSRPHPIFWSVAVLLLTGPALPSQIEAPPPVEGPVPLSIGEPLPELSATIQSLTAPVRRPPAPRKRHARRRGGHLTFMSPHASPIAVEGGRVFVVNTPAGTVDLIDADRRVVAARVPVGIDPVGLAIRPDGKEVWVTNHVSDSVSVIDTDPASPTYLQILATLQDFGPTGFRPAATSRATRFDEPVGIAFADNEKAYVALSAENQIAVIDVSRRRIVDRLAIPAQDPRALAVRNGRLYVIPFESNNQTQISGCFGALDGDLCTFDADQHVIDNNNVLSLGIDVDIVKNPRIPDRDLFVFDTRNDRLVDTVSGVGTLLYGIAVDSGGRVFVAQTDARNDANGRAGTLKHGLAELENRPFLNRITRIDCDGSCRRPRFIDLEPLPPLQPDPELALATPFAIQVSADDSTLVATAAGSNQLFTVDAASGQVLGRVGVGAVPRGVALEPDKDSRPWRAWVLNAVSNSVSLIDLSNREKPRVRKNLRLEDPTPGALRRGREAFHDAAASSTGTFSCESCHPNGHTDQLLWVLSTPPCDRAGCTQIPPRTTMPVRGLRDTAPYHWDGIPGDPFGGNNTANLFGDDPPNCRLTKAESCTRFLVDSSLATTMCGVAECSGRGALDAKQRRDLSRFLLSVPYPPAQRRSYSNVLSRRAVDGFRLFHVDGQELRNEPNNVCGNCHRMPFWVSTNTPGTGMEAPTWRGAHDRWLILPQGRLNFIDLLGPTGIAGRGFPEHQMWELSWARDPSFDAVWDMVLEGSTGFPGAFARQVTLSAATAEAAATADLFAALELAAAEGAVLLQGEGLFLADDATPVALEFRDGRYHEREEGPESWSLSQLTELAAEGDFLGTFTARLGAGVRHNRPQPALWSLGPIEQQRGRQQFPLLSSGEDTLVVSARHVREGAHVVVDGRRVGGSVSVQAGARPGSQRVEIRLDDPPSGTGIHFLQLQNPAGLVSNELIFHTGG